MKLATKQINRGSERYIRTDFLRRTDAPPVRPIIEELSPRKDDIIVEFGAGEGRFALPIAYRMEALNGSGGVYALGSSQIHIDRIAREASAQGLDRFLRAVCLDAHESNTLPPADETVSAVLSVNTLQYMVDPLPYLKEIERILIPGGTLLISDWQRSTEVPSQKTIGSGLSPADLMLKLDAAGLDAHLEIDLPGYVWAVRAVKSIVIFA